MNQGSYRQGLDRVKERQQMPSPDDDPHVNQFSQSGSQKRKRAIERAVAGIEFESGEAFEGLKLESGIDVSELEMCVPVGRHLGIPNLKANLYLQTVRFQIPRKVIHYHRKWSSSFSIIKCLVEFLTWCVSDLQLLNT